MRYKNVRAELVRQSMKQGDLADRLNIGRSTLSNKMNGKSDFTLAEAVRIRDILNPLMPLEKLFAVDGND